MELEASIWRQYYRFPTRVTAVVYGLFAVYAWSIHQLPEAVTVAMLAVLEVVLSFDNAVVNARVLKKLDAKWRHRFLTWGILIAVIGMRLALPTVAVSIGGRVNPIRATVMAVADPRGYAVYVGRAKLALIVFGGVYLLQIFLSFMLDAEEKEGVIWLKWPEQWLEWLGEKSGNPRRLVLAIASAAVALLLLRWPDHKVAVASAGGCAILLQQSVSKLGAHFKQRAELIGNAEESKQSNRKGIDWVMLSLFLYLELQDAMFSFDSVFGGFAFTLLMLLIMMGSGIGALYVRAMTVHIASGDTLRDFQYLANGAFWAIGCLPFCMWFDAPQFVAGGISIMLIGAALLHSWYVNEHD